MYFDHERVRAEGDRGDTADLLDALEHGDASDDERAEIADTLGALDDPSSWPRLLALLEDAARPAALREAAGQALRQGHVTATPAQLARWWSSGDRTLERHALLASGPSLRAVVETVAADGAHPAHAAAIERMGCDFELPRFQALKIAALEHREAAVREAAAWALRWDEAAIAEEPLVALLGDPCVEVQREAVAAVGVHPSQRAWLALSTGALRDREARATAEAAADSLRRRFAAASRSSASSGHVRRWLAPIWVQLAFEEDELHPRPATEPGSDPALLLTPTADELHALLDDEPRLAAVQHALETMDWARCTAAERAALTAHLVEHGEPAVREHAAIALRHWGDHDRLLRLAADPCARVVRAALQAMADGDAHLPPLAAAPSLAAFAWRELATPAVHEHGVELLGVYAAHADRGEAAPRLVEIAGDRERPASLRQVALGRLAAMGDADGLRALVALVAEPPVSWGLVTRFLEQAHRLAVAVPGARDLREVDHLELQVALAPFVA